MVFMIVSSFYGTIIISSFYPIKFFLSQDFRFNIR